MTIQKQIKNEQLTPSANHPIKVWDMVVRVSHWTVAAFVLLNLFITEGGSSVHQIIGYIALVMVIIRLIWGFFGTQYARFSNFFPTLKRIKQYIYQLKNQKTSQPSHNHLGHNPVAALMMLTLWVIIIGLGTTGFLMGTEQFWYEEWLEETHEILANSLSILVAIHVGAAVIMSKVEKINLIKAMITGYKPHQ